MNAVILTFFLHSVGFHLFTSKTYVMGTQKNCLNETVLLSTQNTIFKLVGIVFPLASFSMAPRHAPIL